MDHPTLSATGQDLRQTVPARQAFEDSTGDQREREATLERLGISPTGAARAAGVGPSAPPIRRSSMVATPWSGFWRGLWQAITKPLDHGLGSSDDPKPWQLAASRRRHALLAMVLLSTFFAVTMMAHVLPIYESQVLRVGQIGLFAVLFAWVSAGFFTAMMGFWVQLRGDPHALSCQAVLGRSIDPQARTAIIMPICNEQVATVFGGLRATCESLVATGAAQVFDVFILSDSSDPTLRAAELAAWAQLRTTLGNSINVYYRWRLHRTKRKSGNVADFCRRWGQDYRYMVVLDADSVMDGPCLTTLVNMMEAHPSAGILQTAPQACGLNTLHARAQQFAGRVAGRLFTAGMQYWQLGESHYWGHNAIIRVAPFMQHCALAPLPGHGGLAGDILSHDFVEAALIRRAGYQVWMVSDLPGSYEQQPPNLIEELQRDRRWCQGNLQNARLLTEPGLHGVHRAMLLTGALAYLSAPLWLCSILLGGALCLFGGSALFNLAEGVPLEILGLWSATFLMLLMPRMLGVVTIAMRGEQALYGGGGALVRSAALEGLMSVLQAPIRMVAHTVFVVVALTGLKLHWRSPPREAQDIGWRDALGRFMPIMGVVLLLVGIALAIEPGAALWLAPVALPLMLAVPLTVLSSRSQTGAYLRQHQLLITPEEAQAPAVLRQSWHYAESAQPSPEWHDAVTDPWLFDVVRSAMGTRNTGWGSRGNARRHLVRGLLVPQDTARLSNAERMRLLSEPQSMVRLRDQLAASSSWVHRAWPVSQMVV
jgi:membrane glycosyltransferase